MTVHMHRVLTEGCYRCDLNRDEFEAAREELIADARKAAERVDHYLDTRERHLPFDYDVIVDIDLGSSGHVQLLASDLDLLVERARMSNRLEEES